MFGKEVGDVLVKEDKEDEEMVKQVGRKVVMVIIMCPVRSGTTQQAYTVHGQQPGGPCHAPPPKLGLSSFPCLRGASQVCLLRLHSGLPQWGGNNNTNTNTNTNINTNTNTKNQQN